MTKRKVLSIDGGGIRGIIPALILCELEEKTGRPIAEMFDMVAGTSTGGLLALGLTVPNTGGGDDRAYTAQELLDLYVERGEEIFPCSPWRRFGAFGNFFEEKYDAAPFENILKEYFGESRLKDVRTEVLVTAYALERRDVHFFKSTKAKKTADRDFPLWQVARATAAAPTYFEPLKIEVDDGRDYYSLVDGGVFANNPALCAHVEAKKIWPGDDVAVVSLGTGELTRKIAHDEAAGWGLAGWAQPILDVVFDGIADTTDYHLDKLLNDGGEASYFRFQEPIGDRASDNLDDASGPNLRNLRLHAEHVLQANTHAFEAVCALLED